MAGLARVAPDAAGAQPGGAGTAGVAWQACPGSTTEQCTRVVVPLDYAEPSAGRLSLLVARLVPATAGASHRLLLFNPGGPGESGVAELSLFAALLPRDVARSFELVSFDERGTGSSNPLQCGPPASRIASLDPVPNPGGPLPGDGAFGELAAACLRQAPALVAHLDSTDAARDLDRIRAALGASTISYYGLSYGTVLGSLYARLFPRRVRAMVLDGAVAADRPLTAQAAAEAPAIARSVNHLVGRCRAERSCPLGAHPGTRLAALAQRLTDHPLPPPGGGDPYPVTAGDLATATLLTVSVPSFERGWEAAVAAAIGGHGAPLRALALDLDDDVGGASLVASEWALTCGDAAQRPTARQAGTLARSEAAAEGSLAAESVTYDLGGCLHWPKARQPVRQLAAPGAPPVVVIGTTGDPNTPYGAAADLARQLTVGHLVTWRGWGHTWLLNAGHEPCMDDLVGRYLLRLEAPARGATCP